MGIPENIRGKTSGFLKEPAKNQVALALAPAPNQVWFFFGGKALCVSL